MARARASSQSGLGFACFTLTPVTCSTIPISFCCLTVASVWPVGVSSVGLLGLFLDFIFQGHAKGLPRKIASSVGLAGCALPLLVRWQLPPGDLNDPKVAGLFLQLGFMT